MFIFSHSNLANRSFYLRSPSKKKDIGSRFFEISRQKRRVGRLPFPSWIAGRWIFSSGQQSIVLSFAARQIDHELYKQARRQRRKLWQESTSRWVKGPPVHCEHCEVHDLAPTFPRSGPFRQDTGNDRSDKSSPWECGINDAELSFTNLKGKMISESSP